MKKLIVNRKSKIVNFLMVCVLLVAGCKMPVYEDDNYDMGDPFIATEEKEYVIDCKNTEVTIHIASNVWWEVSYTYPKSDDPEVMDQDDFIMGYTVSGNQNGPRDVTFSLTPNRNGFRQTAFVKVSPRVEGAADPIEFQIVQTQEKPWIEVRSARMSDGTLLLGKTGDEVLIEVMANTDWNIDTETIPWLTFDVASGKPNTKKWMQVNATFNDNAGGDWKTDDLVILNYGEEFYTLPVKQDFMFRKAESSIVDTNTDFSVCWDDVPGAYGYTVQILNTGGSLLSEWSAPNFLTTSCNLVDLFKKNPYSDAIQIAVKTTFKDPGSISTSDPLPYHALFDGKSGDGSVGAEFLIGNIRHLKNINNSSSTLSANYKQIADIDFTGQTISTFTPVGGVNINNPSAFFTGTYSGAKPGGGAYKVINASFEIPSYTTHPYWGMFGIIERATISHLDFENCLLSLTITGTITEHTCGYSHVVGLCKGSTVHHINLRDCEIVMDNAVPNLVAAGGVAGRMICIGWPDERDGLIFAESRVSFCTTRGGKVSYRVIEGPTVTANGARELGGIVGNGIQTNGDPWFVYVEDCINYSTTVQSRGRAGGIASRNINVLRCQNYAKVSGRVNSVGGIIALLNIEGDWRIEDCYNAGEVSLEPTGSSAFVGGILGRWNEAAPVGDVRRGGQLRRCINVGNVTNEGARQNSNFGGILGDLNEKVEGIVMDCINTGNITNTGTGDNTQGTCGGIVGANLAANYPTAIKNCYSTGRVTGAGGGGRYGICGGYPSTAPTTLDVKLTVTSCFFLKGTAASGDDPVNKSPNGRTDVDAITRAVEQEDLRNRQTFAGWDFDNVWEFRSGNYPYPQLKGMPAVGSKPN